MCQNLPGSFPSGELSSRAGAESLSSPFTYSLKPASQSWPLVLPISSRPSRAPGPWGLTEGWPASWLLSQVSS